ncbi:helix-turn-helix transcriptional regulator [Sphingobacterium tabacisoli]|uniref:Helix-turn-helix transcriptional regulator n=1 Tax=Sphingobacterium tabacisoli TaxID=2044855 RepID=A0ABW5L2G0_9SPHI|nr:AraC family transcriptional regulator [Sphingobacterium tabacisoli]
MSILLTGSTFTVFILSAFFIFLNMGKEKIVFNRYLLLMLLLAVFFLMLEYMSQVLASPWLHLVLEFPMGLLYGPGLLLLIHNLPQNHTRTRPIWIHFIPFFVALLIYLFIVQDSTRHYRYSLDYTMTMQFIAVLHLGCYLLYFRPSVSRILRGRVKEHNITKAAWYFSFLLLITCSLLLLVDMIEEPANILIHRIFSVLLYAMFLLGASFVFLMQRRLKKLFYAIDTSKEEQESPVPEKSKKRNTIPLIPLTREQEVSYRNRIELFIQTLAYLDSDLNKDKFSSQLEIPVQHIAPFLKQEFGKGFNAFVNQLRLSYAIRQLKSEELMYTIEDLSMVCGFSSRASFYRNFQAEFGCSPHQYRLDYGED